MFTHFAIGAWLCRVSLRTENVCLMSYMPKAALHLAKNCSHCGRVSEIRFKSLKSSCDSSRQYSLKKMHLRQNFLRARQYRHW